MSRIKNRAAFTLFELLLVLLIIAVLYGLFAQNMSFKTKENEDIKIEKLNYFLVEKFSKNGEFISVRCIENCKECKVLVNGEDNNITLQLFEEDMKVNSYMYDGKRVKSISFDDYYIDEYRRERVCFRMDIYPNKSSDKLILEYDNRVILFDNFLNENRIFNSIQEAEEFLYASQHEARGR